MSKDLIDVLVPIPLLKRFSYKLPEEFKKKKLERGVRIKIPFGNRLLVGIFLGITLILQETIEVATNLLREVIDETSLLEKKLLNLAEWASRYYHYPLGEVITYFFPPSLRRGKKAKI